MSTPVFTNLGVDQGLPHPAAMSVAQDSVGFIWVGTQGGLSRYDGYTFITYQHRDGDPASLPTNFIGDLAAGKDGRMWVVDYGGNVLRFEPSSETFRAFPEPSQMPARGFVERMVADGRGGVWLGMASGLEHIDGDSGTITHLAPLEGVGDAADHIRALRQGRDGSLWVSTDQGLWRRRPDAERFDKVALASEEIGDSPLLDMYDDADGRLWFGTAASEIGRIDIDGTVHKVASLPTSAARRVGRLSMTQAGEALWIGRFGGGVYALDMISGRLRPIRHDPGVPVSLPSNAGRQMITDRAGRVWITTLSGVSSIMPQSTALDSIFPSSRESGISDVDILSMAESSNGKIWLGLSDQGIAALDLAQGRFALLPPVVEAPLSMIPGLAVDDDDTLWVGAIGTPGLYRLDGNRLVDSGWKPEKGDVYRRLLAHGGYLWVAAGPLVRFDPRNGQVRLYHNDADPTSGAVLTAPADAEHLWVAAGRGLELFDCTTGTFRNFVHIADDPRSIPAGIVTAIVNDGRGRLWIGTLGNGIGIGTPDGVGGLKFQRLSMKDGLPNDNITGLLDDKLGQIWASTANGLAAIDMATLAVWPLDRADGLAVSTYSVNSALRLKDGALLFGGRGLSVVHPERFTHPAFDPPVVATALRVNAQARPVSSVKEGFGLLLTLAANARNFEIEFAALDFSAPDTLRYTYRLKGFDKDWISVDARHRVAAYTNLPPGGYTFQVRGGNRAGAWSRTLSLSIAVLPAWWQTWWFLGLAAIAAVLLVVLLIRTRTAVLRLRGEELERLVARQTCDLTESNARLAQSNALLVELAAHDPLTNLLNRRAFVDLADRELERANRFGRPICLLMIDVDHFKRVNDTYGHGAGDDVLRSLSSRIRASLRTSDICARMGGEELAVLMAETPPEPALLVAQSLSEAIAKEEHRAGEVCFQVTVSIGLAARRDQEDLTRLLERADQALYAAKTGGRNRVVTADEA